MPVKKKIKLLRAFLKKRKCNYYLIPRTDKFLNEFISDDENRVQWLTGFTGSYAFVIISLRKNIIFTDGRYINQIKKEVDQKNFWILDINEITPTEWLKRNIKSKEKILLDSWLFTCENLNKIKKNLEEKNEICVCDEILIDRIWKKRIKKNNSRIFIRKEKFSGDSFKKKFLKVKKILKRKNINNFFFSSPESISWLLNIRSREIAYNPIALSFLLLSFNQKSIFFGKKDKILKNYLGTNFDFCKINNLKNSIINYSILNKEIFLDPSNTPYYIENFFRKVAIQVNYTNDPCINLKLVKNPVEIRGSVNSHIRDGISICKFIFWLKESIKKSNKVTELEASKKLYELRKKNKYFNGLSFETISAFGSNGAIIHYRVTNKTNKTLSKNNLYLFDSGAQYLDGTTDITRTVSLGMPTSEQKDMFTRVLKGNINLSTYKFNEKTTGKALDKLARKFLNEKKFDYSHGTGHGIGSYLSVHEGPLSISKKSNSRLKPGMLLTNEPGFYKINEYGIRLENVILVFKKNRFLNFKVLTLAPIDINLLDTKLLNIKEKTWINNYHNKVYKKIGKYLNKKESLWLKKETSNI